MPKQPSAITPTDLVARLAAYSPPRHPAPIDLKLDANEGSLPDAAVLEAVRAAGPAAVRRYPDAGALEAEIAARIGVPAAQVLVTAGADDALERAMRVVLGPGRELVLPVPTFEMLDHYARLLGCGVREVPWLGGGYPLAPVVAALNERTAAVAVVTPNSPTGLVATAADLERLSAAAPGALIIVDQAYVEYADEDLLAAALALPNAVVFRTLSKAWGLAGLRVGWAVGPPALIGPMRAAGHPYAVAAPSLAIAAARLRDGAAAVDAHVARVRAERDALTERLAALGAAPLPSQANFVYARFRDAGWARDGLAGLGIGVRRFPDKPHLDDGLRITLPGDAAAFARLADGLAAVLDPQAILFDMDDTLADTSESYREAIRATAAELGVALDQAVIGAAKAAGNANNDWELTRRLLAERGVERSLAEVTERFEALYQGTADDPGLRARERLLAPRALLEQLAGRVRLGVVTGRPRDDAEAFLAAQGIGDLFDVLVTMDDAPLKPDPAPVRLALERLGVTRAWMVGDTPDDVRAARGAGVVPLGVVAPLDDPREAGAALYAAGAARVIGELAEIKELLS